jgi:hypothetical protein
MGEDADRIVDELRAACDKLDLSFDPAFTALWRKAADRIEALEAALAIKDTAKAAPHSYSPDYQAMGDCRVCGHQPENCIGEAAPATPEMES